MEETNKRFSINRTSLKYIAIIAMLIDHLAWAFVPEESPLGIIMHFIGRTTGPIMFFMAVEGYHHTRNLKKYCLRLLIFAIISYFPFIYFSSNGNLSELNYFSFNIIFTILLGIIAVYIRREIKNPVLKVILILCISIISLWCDWGFMAIVIILTFDFYYGNYKNQMFAYTLIILFVMGLWGYITSPFYSLMFGQGFIIDAEDISNAVPMIGAFVPMILLKYYNGNRGSNSKFSKWFFYIFYPLHLLVIGFIANLI